MSNDDSVVQFEIIVEQKPGVWISAGTTLQKCIVEDVNITTTGKTIDVENGYKPQIIPLGVDKCTCKFVGEFVSNIYSGTSLGEEVDDRDLLSPLRTDKTEDGDDILAKGLKLISGSNNFPELVGKWKLTMFTWDRQAVERGKYRFTMELSWIYTNPKEPQLFGDSTGYEMAASVKYYAAVISDTEMTASYPIFNTDIRKTLADLNTAKFSTVGQVLNKYNEIKIFPTNGGIVLPAFHGYVKSVITEKGITSYECNEMGGCIYDIAIKNPTSGLFKPRVMIRNPLQVGSYLTIQQITTKILSFFISHSKFPNYNVGEGIDRSTLGKTTKVPGRNIYLPSQIMSGMTVGKAIANFLENDCGFHTWFRPEDSRLEYGFIRDKITIDPKTEYITSSSKISDDYSLNISADVVCVFNSDGRGSAYPTQFATNASPTVLYYRINTNQMDQKLSAFAQKIYEDSNVDKSSYRVRFPPGIIRFKEGDVFAGLGDQTTDPVMPYRTGEDANVMTNPGDSVWQVKDVRLTETYTECIVGPTYYSIFDIYKSALQKVDGSPALSESLDWESPNVTVGKTIT